MFYLVKSVDFLSICSEGHESSVQINKTANHKVLLTDSCLLRVAELSSPNHVAVAAFDAIDRKYRAAAEEVSYLGHSSQSDGNSVIVICE